MACHLKTAEITLKIPAKTYFKETEICTSFRQPDGLFEPDKEALDVYLQQDFCEQQQYPQLAFSRFLLFYVIG